MGELIPCRCRAQVPANPDHHGTAPDGRLAERSAVPHCDLCSGSGRTTRGRLSAATWARGLALLGLAALGLAAGAWAIGLASAERGSLAQKVAAPGLASLAAAGLLELYLARTAQGSRRGSPS